MGAAPQCSQPQERDERIAWPRRAQVSYNQRVLRTLGREPRARRRPEQTLGRQPGRQASQATHCPLPASPAPQRGCHSRGQGEGTALGPPPAVGRSVQRDWLSLREGKQGVRGEVGTGIEGKAPEEEDRGRAPLLTFLMASYEIAAGLSCAGHAERPRGPPERTHPQPPASRCEDGACATGHACLFQ